MSQSQKALVVEKVGAPFTIREVQIPKPGPGELLVKVQSVALNPVDWKIQKGAPFGLTFPVILGGDIAGDVEEVGEGVTKFKKGDRVFFQDRFGPTGGGYQQHVIALAATTAKIPPNLSYDDAATVPLVLSAAYVGLYNKNPHGLGIPLPDEKQSLAGTPFVVIGGSASVGQMVIQLAKLSGFSPIITTASPSHTDLLKSLGATHVFDRRLPLKSLLTEISKVVDPSLIKHAFDCIGEESTQQLGCDLVASGGQLATVRPPLITAPTDKSIIRVLGLLRAPGNIELLEDLYQNRVAGYLESGAIKPNRVEVLAGGLSGIPDGLARMEANKISRLKLVAHPQDTA